MGMKEASLFKNGQSQAVRLPKEFRMPGKSVYIRKVGQVVMLIPKNKSWDAAWEACDRFTTDFMAERDQGVHEREELF